MKDKFIRYSFDKVINVTKLITIFYMEFSKDFCYEGEQHDFWEMVYIDRGEAICTASTRQFVLKSGELTFHRPNEFHAIRADGRTAPNVSILTFECKSPAIRFFEGKIFRLTQEQKAFASMLFREGIAAYALVDKSNPLLQQMEKLENAPFGSAFSMQSATPPEKEITTSPSGGAMNVPLVVSVSSSLSAFLSPAAISKA